MKVKILTSSIIITLIFSLMLSVCLNHSRIKQIGKIYKTDNIKARLPYGSTNPKIPRGFEYLEGTVNTGFVIRDKVNGNEFVWVPVDGTNVVYQDRYMSALLGEEEIISQNLVNSVSLFGGFYIGRYEAGVPSTLTFGNIEQAMLAEKNFAGIPVSKKNVIPWNSISFQKAKESAELMYDLTTTGIMSTLINSAAWDATLNWLVETGAKTTADIEERSTDWGNYYDSTYSYQLEDGTHQKLSGEEYMYTTGKSEQNKANNIYDLAGNMLEFTTLTCDFDYDNINESAMHRGGGFNYVGDVTVSQLLVPETQQYVEVYPFPVSDYSYTDIAGEFYGNLGFRVTLYMTDEPYIPTGFEYVEGTEETGWVIQDEEGNEFVWVPINGTTVTLEKKEWGTGNYSTPAAQCSDGNLTALQSSITQEGGFYIARYEASAAGISKKSQTPIFEVSYNDAITRCNEYSNAYSEISSHLVYGVEWDAALKFIETGLAGYATNTNVGNSSQTIKLTGDTTTDKQKNICDLAGNLREWTQETYNTNYKIFRGGYYNYNFHAGYRNNDVPETADKYIGYRAAFYIK